MARKPKAERVIGDLGVSPAAAIRQIDRLLDSELLSGSPTLAQILDVLADAKLNGKVLNEHAIHERVHGADPEWVGIYDRDVAVRISRLNKLLEKHALGEGRQDPVRVHIAARELFFSYNLDSPIYSGLAKPGQGRLQRRPLELFR